MRQRESMTTVVVNPTGAAWDQIAHAYDEFVTPTHMRMANEGLRRARVATGMSLVDVAAGSGALSIPAARLGARVMAVDLSPVMLERLMTRARAEGITDVETRVMDGEQLDLPDNSFDVAASQYGVMLFTDFSRGLREMARVTRPGGRVLLQVFGPPTQIEFEELFFLAMRAVVPEFDYLPADPVPLPDRLRAELSATGLVDIEIDTIRETQRFRSGGDMWDWSANSHPIGAEVAAALNREQRAAVRGALDRLLRDRADGAGNAVLTHPVHIAIGTKSLPES